MNNYALAVILGLSPTGLFVARELGLNGISVLGVDKEFSCGQFSRYLTHNEKYWRIKENRQLLDKLLGLAAHETRKPVLIPTSDYYIDFVARNSESLKKKFLFQESYENGLALSIMDKVSFRDLCSKHDVQSPMAWGPATRNELQYYAEQVAFPCLIKPKFIHEARDFMRGKKVLWAKSKPEFDSLIQAIPNDSTQWLVQEIIPGPESNIFVFAGYFDRDSQPVHSFTARKLRQYPPGFGSASLVQSEICQEVHDLSVNLLKAIKFTGLCGTEFKYDPRDCKYKIIEINPRPTLWFDVANKAGKRFALTAYSDLSGMQIHPQQQQLDGVRWSYAVKDMISSCYYLRTRKGFILPAPESPKTFNPVKKKTWAVFDWLDPMPALIELIRFGRIFLTRKTR